MKAKRPTFAGCYFGKHKGHSCDLSWPRWAVRSGYMTWESAVRQLCAPCQPHAVPLRSKRRKRR